MVSVLFTRKNSVYNTLGVDTWDLERDALKWPGGNPIIAHPPCRAWASYRSKAKPREGEKELAIWAVNQIRIWGGILEHPKNSKLWEEMNLPKGNQTDEWGGFTINIDQKWFGHRAKKNTNLYIVGIKRMQVPLIPITFEPHTRTIEDMGKPEREATPLKLAQWLIKTANLI